MSGLRSSNSVTNTVVDTLRIRGVTEPGLLITSSSGAVSVGTAPTLTNLAVTGTSMLGSAVVLGSLTSNSVNALASLTTPNASITNLDVSNATIANLDFTAASINSLDASSATITNASITNLDVSYATIANLDFTAASINSLDASSATITNASITNLDVSNATIANLDASAASISSLDASAAVIINLDASSASISSLDASNATITILDVSAASISSLDASNANIDILDASAASIHSLDASNATITYLDVSSATFKRLDASSALINTLTSTNATVSAGLFARYALIGDNTNTGDLTNQNFVFIQAPSGETFGRVRGSNLPTGSLQLGAHANLTNIVLNADGSTDISGRLVINNPIHATYTSPYITTFSWVFPVGGLFTVELTTPVSPAGLWYCGVKAVTIETPPNFGVVFGFISTTYVTDGSLITYGGAAAMTSGNPLVNGTHVMYPTSDLTQLVYASPESIPGNYEAKFILLMTF